MSALTRIPTSARMNITAHPNIHDALLQCTCDRLRLAYVEGVACYVHNKHEVWAQLTEGDAHCDQAEQRHTFAVDRRRVDDPVDCLIQQNASHQPCAENRRQSAEHLNSMIPARGIGVPQTLR